MGVTELEISRSERQVGSSGLESKVREAGVSGHSGQRMWNMELPGRMK